MAIMIPDKPKEFEVNSHEDLMFEALATLPDTYYVFHSFSIVSIVDSIVYESETDFVIFHPQKGVLCLEAKAGQVKYEDGLWKYGSGKIMSHDGPFNQSSSNKWKLCKYIKENGIEYLLGRCKFLHAVWFPSVVKEKFQDVYLPSEADLNLMLTSESFEHLEEEISKIFAIQLPNRSETNLSKKDIQIILNRVLAPSFNLISLSQMRMNHNKLVFKRMLKEQVALLNYLEEQKSAIINGLAGTGKTVMALEKAKRHADNGEKVLFLCYNVNLKNYLREAYAHDNIAFYTIDGLACRLCDTQSANYKRLEETLEEMYMENNFPYRHIIIDEGQDFGKNQMEEIELINLLKANVLDDESKEGSFYLFYDMNQMVQAENIPEYISKADCKLTLYKNCRNTQNIAETSMRMLGIEKRPKLFDGAVLGDLSEMCFASSKSETIYMLNKIIEKNWELGYQDITILSCKTLESSAISEECSNNIYLYKGKRIPVSTCRKFKGLEADSIIMIDMDYELFSKNSEQILYVGSSRARYKLACVVNLTDSQCEEILEKLEARKTKNVKKALATAYNAEYVEGNW